MLYIHLFIDHLLIIRLFVLSSFLAIIAWLSTQLAKQKKIDFKPRNDDTSFARDNTEPCVGCCDFLEKVKDVAKQSLTGKNQEVFLTEVGVAFHRYAFHVFTISSFSSQPSNPP